METITPRLWSWAVEPDANTIAQSHRAAALPVVVGHVALMPDAHVGIGATVGSVIPTEGAIIPSAVGVDIGCGMAALRTDLTAADLPDNLDGFLPHLSRTVPAGVGQGHSVKGRSSKDRSDRPDRGVGARGSNGGRGLDGLARVSTRAAEQWFEANPPPDTVSGELLAKATDQFATLGSGNHFFEVCLDELDRVWLFLHSGSRGVGNILAQRHIDRAKRLAKHIDDAPRDLDLAWFVQGTDDFTAYITDMLWAQAYAYANREAMLNAAFRSFTTFVRRGREVERINCHHNYATQERHVVDGTERVLWITRKGAIRAGTGDLGLIPGSMGTRSYVVRGLGNEASWQSCSHGAGRRMSRTEAKRTHTAKDLREQMAGRSWQSDQADKLIDEIPSAYKDIDQVMAAQSDLVEVVHSLRQVLNYKGT